ncbi:MAG: hypothetical protein U0935_04510 [Pirellulales bacterium]
MGQFRFLVPHGDRLSEASVQRAYLGGADHVPWLTEASWEGPLLVVEREVRESGVLALPWFVAGHGEVVLSTTSLMERKQPYDLTLELARGTLHRLRAQLAQWQLLGFQPAAESRSLVEAAQEAFLRAATHQSQPDCVLESAELCLQSALSAIDRICAEFAVVAIESRLTPNSQLTTLLGAPLESPPLDGKAAKWVQASFNTAQLPFCWAEQEQTPGVRSYGALENQLRWCRELGLKTIAGPLFRPNRRSWPTWLDARTANFETLQRHVIDYVQDTVRTFQGKVHVWHAAAAVAGDNETRLTEEQRLRLVVNVVETVRQLDARTPLIVSFDQPWGEYMTRRHYDLSPLHFADMLVRSDLGIAGLGLEINFGYEQRATWPRDLLEVNRQIDHWSTLGLPLLVFLTAPSNSGTDPWAREPVAANPRLGASGPSPEWQKRFAERFVPFLIAKQAVHSVIWNQLRDEFPHDFPHGGLFDRDGARKPAIEALADVRQRHLT